MATDQTETSPVSETPADAGADTSASAAATPDVSAESSPAETDVSERPSLLDVVKAVVETKPEGEQGAASGSDPKTEGTTAEEASREATPDELENLPFGKHPRFKEVLGQRDEARQKAAEIEARIAEIEPAAQQWGLVRGFMSDNQLSDEDMLDGFRMMAAVRMNPLEGRKLIASYLDELDTTLGLKLPDDLREDLDYGKISEERAYELSRTRAANAASRQQDERRQSEQQQTQQREQTQQHVNAMTSAAADWEQQARSSDPDFDRKADMIADRMQAIVAGEGKAPATAAEMASLLTRAHEDVTNRLKAIVPPPRPISRPTSAAPSKVAAPQPKSMREAIALAAGG